MFTDTIATMGRIPRGQTPKTRAEITEAYRDRLAKAKGHRLIADIGPEAAAALTQLTEDGTTKKEAVSRSLVHLARVQRGSSDEA
jgi:hypothetical protein